MRNWMTQALGDTLCNRFSIGLSDNGIAVLRTSDFLKQQITVVAEQAITTDTADHKVLHQRMAAQCHTILAEAHYKGMPVHVILSDHWVRMFMVTPAKNANSLQDCRAAAEMRFTTLYGDAMHDWTLNADWHAAKPFLACAIPQTLLHGLTSAIKDGRGHLMCLTPNFIVALNRWRTKLHSDAWFGVVQDKVLTLGVMEQHGLCAVRHVIMPEGGVAPAWLHAHVAQEALRLNVPMPSKIQLCGAQNDVTPHNAGTASTAKDIATANPNTFHIIYLESPNKILHQASTHSVAMLLARAGIEGRI